MDEIDILAGHRVPELATNTGKVPPVLPLGERVEIAGGGWEAMPWVTPWNLATEASAITAAR
jgi:hypothetical protein